MTTANETKEFLEASVSDLFFIRDSLTSRLTHPTFSGNDPFLARIGSSGRIHKSLFATSTRMLVLSVSAAMERLQSLWDGTGFLEEFWKANNNSQMSNSQKIDALELCLENLGNSPDRQVLDEFLAIKHLRNTVAHTGWKLARKEHLERLGFPADLRAFSFVDFSRLLSSAATVFGYISCSAFFYQSVSSQGEPSEFSNELGDLAIALGHSWTPSKELISPGDMANVWWNIMERMDDGIFEGVFEPELIAPKAIQVWDAYLGSPQFDSALTKQGVMGADKTLMELHDKRFYPRGPIGVPVRCFHLLGAKLEQERKAFDLSNEETSSVRAALESLSRLELTDDVRIWDKAIPIKIVAGIVPLLVANSPKSDRIRIAESIRIGSLAKLAVRNRCLESLFLRALKSQGDLLLQSQIREAGLFALMIFRTGISWYEWLESTADHFQHPRKNYSELWPQI